MGEWTHQQLAEKYGRQPSAISNFSSRNKDEINAAKKEMSGEDIEPWGTRNGTVLPCIRSIWLRSMTDCSPGAAPARGQIPCFVAKVLHQLAEEKGELPTRGALEVDFKSNPFANIDEVAIDEDGNLHQVRSTATRAPAVRVWMGRSLSVKYRPGLHVDHYRPRAGCTADPSCWAVPVDGPE